MSKVNDKPFTWGVSSAAFQTEGAWEADGKGLSVWDVFTSQKRKVRSNHNARIATNFYNLYCTDLAILNSLDISNFRFSISWPRIIPSGKGAVNMKGIDFYNRVIDFALEQNISPWLTLYHWDLPFELEKKGGWRNREILNWFSEYVEICCRHFGDRVKNWMVLNEPMVFTGAGYFLGVHAPGRKGLNNFLSAVHHAALCQAEGGRIIRSQVPVAKIGTTFSCSLVEPYTSSIEDRIAANRVDALLNRLFVEPLNGDGYPAKDLPFLRRLEPLIKSGDEEKLAFNMDFIGVQNYTREIIKYSWYTPFIKAKICKAENRNVPVTDMNWEVYPKSIYEMLKKFNNYKSFGEIIVTENGAAFPDVIVDGQVYDKKRRFFIEKNITEVLKARKDGVNVNGYFVWSATDNFEWAEGYHPRFGLVYVDYTNQKRIIKHSGYWYSRFISEFPENLSLYGL